MISSHQLNAIQAQLESVCNQCFKRTIETDDETGFLCTWRNDARIDYILHAISSKDGKTFWLAFAAVHHKDIRTHYDRRLDVLEFRRLIDDPRQCVRHLVGQQLDHSF